MNSLRHYILAIACIFAVGGSDTCSAQSMERWKGDWLGKFLVKDLRILFRIDPNKPQSVSWSSPNQGLPLQQVKSATMLGDSIIITLSSPAASFRGKLSSNGELIQGTWKQYLEYPLTLIHCVDYNTVVTFKSGDSLHLTFPVAVQDTQRYALLYSPDQSEGLTAATRVLDSAGHLELQFPSLHASLSASYGSSEHGIRGTFTQFGDANPVVLTRSTLPIWKPAGSDIFNITQKAPPGHTFEGVIKETFHYPTYGTSSVRTSWYRNGNVLFKMGDSLRLARLTKINYVTNRLFESYYGEVEQVSNIAPTPTDSIRIMASEALRPTGMTHVINGKKCYEYAMHSSDNGVDLTNLYWLTDDLAQDVKDEIISYVIAFSQDKDHGWAFAQRMRQLNMAPIEYEAVGANGIDLIETVDEVKPQKVDSKLFEEK